MLIDFISWFYSSDYSKIKTRGEKIGLDSAKISIERVSVCKSILVSGISSDTTHDVIKPFFEIGRNNGGSVQKVRFHAETGCALVVFQDARGKRNFLSLSLLQKRKDRLLQEHRRLYIGIVTIQVHLL